MISTLLTVAFSLSSLALGSAIPNSRRDGILRLPVRAEQSSLKRQVVSPLANVQTGTRYMVEFAIGTPPQNIELSLDTGSSETWVNPTCSAAGGQISIDLCNSFPVFNPNASSTAKDLGFGNNLAYGKGTAAIEYFSDSFTLGGATVTGQQFGVASSSTDLPTGLMGVGPGLELTGYPIIIDTLATQGVTNSRAFSLDLRSYTSPDGAIIFGGIDTAKYTGSLEKLPIIPAAQSPDGYPRYWVYMNSVGITKPGEAKKLYAPSSTNSQGQPVFLDSGGTLTRLPTALVNAIVADFPSAAPDGTSGLYTVDCAVGDTDGTVDFGFGNTIINVPYNEFIWHIQGFCYLGIAADDATPVLGDSFLRAAFVVYDQDNQNLHVANSKNCGTNLVPIGTGVDAVPSIVGQCAAASSTSSSASSTATSSSSTISSSDSSTITSSASVTSTASSVSGFPTISSNSSAPFPIANSTTTAGPTAGGSASGSASGILGYPTQFTTSTAYSISKYTSNGVVTQTVVGYTTVCPVTAKATPTYTPNHEYATKEVVKTVYATQTYTISKCPATVKNCPYGQTTTTYAPVSTEVYTQKYVATSVAGYIVVPYELVAHPAPVAPSVPIVYPVPLQTYPAVSTPAGYPAVPTADVVPVESLKPVKYTTVSSFALSSYVPVATGPVVSLPVVSLPVVTAPVYPAATPVAVTEKPGSSATGTGSLPGSTYIPFQTGGAGAMKVGSLWAVAVGAIGFLVMI